MRSFLRRYRKNKTLLAMWKLIARLSVLALEKAVEEIIQEWLL